MDNVMLSIYIATYNHEKYIARALDSILMQETKYTYEVLIGEDCSTDSTRQILMEYEKSYSGKFQMFYREHNMRNEKISNSKDLIMRCQGKYIIALEGDDYWLDKKKIDKQIQFLEEHSEYIAVAHNCIVVDENSEPNGETYPECKQSEYTIKHFAYEIMPGQLTTVMYRNIYRDNIIDMSIFEKKLVMGDRRVYFSLVSNGKVHCMQEVMSAYRHVTTQGSSFSATYRYRFSEAEAAALAYLEYARLLKKKEVLKYAEFIYLRTMLIGVRDKEITLKQLKVRIQQVSGKIAAMWICIKYMLR